MAVFRGTSVNFYQTTRRYNPEDSHLRTHRRENIKSYNAIFEKLRLREGMTKNYRNCTVIKKSLFEVKKLISKRRNKKQVVHIVFRQIW
jgi:hypothetical protein